MDYHNTKYFKVGRACELSGSDKVVYRALEMMPGFLSWATLVSVVVLSYWAPVAAAYFIITFDLYWLLKTLYLSLHLRYNWRRLKYNITVDWSAMLSDIDEHSNIVHLVIMPFYKEDLATIEESIRGLLETDYDLRKIAVVLASEERGGSEAQTISRFIEQKYAEHFGYFLATRHPKDIGGELAGKGANTTHALEAARRSLLDPNGIDYDNVVVSILDADTVVCKQYFSCLSWHFLTVADPHKVSFQPVPFYNNNVWHASALSRLVGASSTFWQMIQQERPERLATFSSHSVSFRSLYEINYGQTNVVSEDSRIFWNLFLARDGDYSVLPLSYPVSMDSNVAPGFWQTVGNVYRQYRRWSYGAENIPYVVFGLMKNRDISLWQKMKTAFVQIEGFWSLATSPIIIFLLGWLPVVIGGHKFNELVLSYRLPVLTRDMMIVAMGGLVMSAIVFRSFLPKRPSNTSRLASVAMILQWVFAPFTMVLFGALPGLEAQTRLMLGRYMGFWTTPKYRP